MRGKFTRALRGDTSGRVRERGLDLRQPGVCVHELTFALAQILRRDRRLRNLLRKHHQRAQHGSLGNHALTASGRGCHERGNVADTARVEASIIRHLRALRLRTARNNVRCFGKWSRCGFGRVRPGGKRAGGLPSNPRPRRVIADGNLLHPVGEAFQIGRALLPHRRACNGRFTSRSNGWQATASGRPLGRRSATFGARICPALAKPGQRQVIAHAATAVADDGLSRMGPEADRVAGELVDGAGLQAALHDEPLTAQSPHELGLVLRRRSGGTDPASKCHLRRDSRARSLDTRGAILCCQLFPRRGVHAGLVTLLLVLILSFASCFCFQLGRVVGARRTLHAIRLERHELVSFFELTAHLLGTAIVHPGVRLRAVRAHQIHGNVNVVIPVLRKPVMNRNPRAGSTRILNVVEAHSLNKVPSNCRPDIARKLALFGTERK